MKYMSNITSNMEEKLESSTSIKSTETASSDKNDGVSNRDGENTSVEKLEPATEVCRRLSLGEEEDDGKRKRRKEDHLYVPKAKGNSSVGGSPKPGVLTENQDIEDKGGVESPGPKVPPLKIVIPQQVETEQNNRNGKTVNTRHHVSLPYIVVSNEDSIAVTSSTITTTPENDGTLQTNSSTDTTTVSSTEEQRSQHRVLRSNQRGGPSGRTSENPSPLVAETSPPSDIISQNTPQSSADTNVADEKQATNPVISGGPIISGPPTSSEVQHPRKRKLKGNREVPEPVETIPFVTNQHPHEVPVTNCYQMYIDLRKQVERKRKLMFPIQPKPPQGFKDYLMNKCSYLLADNAESRIKQKPAEPPDSCPIPLRSLFIEQENERIKLKMRHLVEKEKLVINVEQEILRVHGRAARALANQALPFSVCTLLKDEEVYNAVTPEQEEKDRNARSRYNGRLFLSWLQDVDDKWEKIKEEMLMRHRSEACGLQARQKMVWSIQLSSLGLYEGKRFGEIEDSHVPLVYDNS